MKIRNKISNQSTRKCITILDNQTFSLVESYKSLRTNILFSLPAKENGCRKILLTSANPGDGKTTTSVNMAITLAQANIRVLIIDADMRKPTVHKYFGIESRVGLSNALSGMNKLDECIQPVKQTENLWVITSGILPPNPSELLSSKNMTQLIETLETRFDFIIIDTPPVNIVTDALAVSKLVDGVAVVCAQNVTRYPDLKRAVASLEFADANILGFVLNKVHKSKSKYGKNYSYSYRYKYKSPKSEDGVVSPGGLDTLVK